MDETGNGFTVMTRGAAAVLRSDTVLAAISRHGRGDWGGVSPDGAEANDEAVRCGDGMILSSYLDNGVEFWVVSHAQGGPTTVLLPEEY